MPQTCGVVSRADNGVAGISDAKSVMAMVATLPGENRPRAAVGIAFSTPRPPCGERSDRSCDPGEGDSPRVALVERAPHPDPLPRKAGRGGSKSTPRLP